MKKTGGCWNCGMPAGLPFQSPAHQGGCLSSPAQHIHFCKSTRTVASRGFRISVKVQNYLGKQLGQLVLLVSSNLCRYFSPSDRLWRFLG
jgi:hypothetical protein